MVVAVAAPPLANDEGELAGEVGSSAQAASRARATRALRVIRRLRAERPPAEGVRREVMGVSGSGAEVVARGGIEATAAPRRGGWSAARRRSGLVALERRQRQHHRS